MGNSIWSIEYFTCPNCGMNYTATREQHRHKHSGRFECNVCTSEVHAWSGPYEFHGWKVDNTPSPEFGRRWLSIP